jgi:hypothetical protein
MARWQAAWSAGGAVQKSQAHLSGLQSSLKPASSSLYPARMHLRGTGEARTHAIMSAQTLSRCALPSGGSVGMHEVGARGVRAQRRGGTGVSSGARLCSMAARGVQVMEVLWAEAGHRNEAHLLAGAAPA